MNCPHRPLDYPPCHLCQQRVLDAAAVAGELAACEHEYANEMKSPWCHVCGAFRIGLSDRFGPWEACDLARRAKTLDRQREPQEGAP